MAANLILQAFSGVAGGIISFKFWIVVGNTHSVPFGGIRKMSLAG